MGKKTRASRRRAQRRKKAAAKAAVQKPVEEETDEELCEICAHPFTTGGPDENETYDVHVQVMPGEWQARGCQCPDRKWCVGCCRRFTLNDAKRCCLDPRCHIINVPCPWCRLKVNVTDLYDDFARSVPRF